MRPFYPCRSDTCTPISHGFSDTIVKDRQLSWKQEQHKICLTISPEEKAFLSFHSTRHLHAKSHLAPRPISIRLIDYRHLHFKPAPSFIIFAKMDNLQGKLLFLLTTSLVGWLIWCFVRLPSPSLQPLQHLLPTFSALSRHRLPILPDHAIDILYQRLSLALPSLSRSIVPHLHNHLFFHPFPAGSAPSRSSALRLPQTPRYATPPDHIFHFIGAQANAVVRGTGRRGLRVLSRPRGCATGLWLAGGCVNGAREGR